MAINSYFYDSLNGDRVYSSKDFAKAFGMAFTNGVIANEDGTLGLEVTGADNRTVNAGKAMINGHFFEVTGTETLTVPNSSFAGQIVVRIDTGNERKATLLVRTDQTPIQTESIYEMPLYNVTVTDGAITAKTDLRKQGGAIAKTAANVVTWKADANGVRVHTGFYNGSGKEVVLFLTSSQPSASSTEHRVWIQIDNF